MESRVFNLCPLRHGFQGFMGMVIAIVVLMVWVMFLMVMGKGTSRAIPIHLFPLPLRLASGGRMESELLLDSQSLDTKCTTGVTQLLTYS